MGGKRFVDGVLALAGSAVLVMAAAAPATGDTAGLAGSAAGWRILTTVTLPNGNRNFMTSHPEAAEGGGLSFPLPKEGDGYTNYLLLNYNRDLTGMEISAAVSVDGTATFVERPGCAGPIPPSVRIEFQDTSAGTYLPTDYWWSDVGGATTLANASGAPVPLVADTNNLADWSDINGESALTHPDEFAAALKNVKEVNLSFGGGSCFANGVAVTDGPAVFTLHSLTIN